MAKDSLLLELIAQWETARATGKPCQPEQLCVDHPEYLEPLRLAIGARNVLETMSYRSRPDNDTQAYLPASPPPTTPVLQEGDVVAGFTVLRPIGHGGFGQVFEAEDAMLQRKVAIKFLHSAVLQRPESRDRFLGEARAMAAISNDYVVPIYHVGQHDQNLFLVMPLLAGETLATKLQREGILPLSEFLRIARELASGLSAIHAKGLIHRDLKPANIWLETGTGRVKILDLGLADEVANLQYGATAGTPAYMSPEQIDGQPLDFRSDLFSLGAIYYECLTACRAFSGRTMSEIIDAVRHGSPLAMTQANPATPTAISELVMSLLQKDRARRPVSAQAVLESLPPSLADTMPAQRALPARRYLPWLLIGLVAFAGLVGAGGLWWHNANTKPATNPAPDAPPPPVASKLTIEQVEVTPLQLTRNQDWQELLPLSRADSQRITTEHAIDVKVKLSQPGYSYIVLYRADGENVLLYPRQPDQVPPLTDQPCYPPRGEDVAYQLNDGPGVWVVSVIGSSQPLPSYRDWQARHATPPWSAQPDPTLLSGVVFDDGLNWATPKQGGGFTRGSRGEIKIARRVPIQPLLDWWKETSQAAVRVIAFPVVDK